ncbi:hypothetical protein [Leptolyngbya sp. FACHB-711]|uniref:hypothetical protein n=1 Tax=unclassified Leptolyngbya TaxID=2650499 RepID=UPI001684601F|nr:hypothetical protein [Leptolyngbya sp. FACHB-711]MBD1852089.1 hypothetical protein [Cyanobacteria bacterium FACHB-502]MBD2024803.1 hypothetical protein [Leptolyngbya sp. FACHB-711]
MAKSRKLEELTASLNQIRPDPTSETASAVLQQVLSSKYSVAAAQAAGIVAQAELYAFIPDLVDAFDRFLIKPKDNDPGCLAKQAIADTLYRLEYSNETLFLKGIRHVQPEPIWGGTTDTAPRLRGTCALGLVRMNYPQVIVELGDLLADPEPEARIGAARAIAYSANDQGVPLLRLRVKVGDTSPVLSECLLALLQLAPQQSLPLVEDVLYARTAMALAEADQAEAAVLALSESQLNEAFLILRDWWQGIRDPQLRKTGILAISTLRQPEAIQFLLTLIAEGKPEDAKEATEAMGIHIQDQILWQRVCQAMQERQDAALKGLLEQMSKS